MFYITIAWLTLKMAMPYRIAKNFIAYNYYTKTEMYRIRRVEMGKKFANKSFADYREDKLFMTHLTFKDKLSAFFTPWKHADKYFREDF